MGSRDPRVDAYIARSAPFAQPILRYLREVVHEASPDIDETIKWSVPHFMYDGRILCAMAGFKQHCGFHIWKGSAIAGERSGEAMGQFGRITSLSDLPSRSALRGYIRKAMALKKEPRKPRAAPAARARKPLKIPSELSAALRANRKAAAAFDAFPPSHKREYAEWIAEAKRDETRKRRIATAVEWIAEGRSRNWKYERPRS